MKRLGVVLHRFGNNLVVRGDEIKASEAAGKIPKFNSVVMDKAVNQIGTVIHVFGPVNHPYFLVKSIKRITDSEFRFLFNERVYVR